MSEKEKLLQSLIQKSGKTQEEIEELVADKVNELSGLVSSEGAIYIVANELGVRLDSEKPKKDAKFSKIADIKEAKTPTSLECKVIRKYDLVNFSSQKGTEGSVQSLLVGDETGIIRIVFWNEQTELLENIHEGDSLRISNGYTRENMNSERIEVHYGQYSDIEVNPEGLTITLKEYKGEEVEFKEKKISELEEGERNVKLKGTITDFDIPRFYLACPHTFKKVFQDEGKYLSPVHGEVDPIRVPIVNVVIDDGTSSLVVVAFRDRAEALTGANSESIIGLAENIDRYREFSKKMIGSQVEIGGNVSLSNLTGEKQVILNQLLSIEFKDIEEIAEELAQEDTKKKVEKKASPKKEEKTTSSDEDELDIEEIDFDEDF